jgi:hypothetical protein
MVNLAAELTSITASIGRSDGGAVNVLQIVIALTNAYVTINEISDELYAEVTPQRALETKWKLNALRRAVGDEGVQGIGRALQDWAVADGDLAGHLGIEDERSR